MTHERVTRTLDVEGDAPQLTSREACRKRDTQDNPAGAFVDQTPRLLGRDPVGVPGDDWLLQVVLNAPGASWIAALLHEERTKNEKKKIQGRRIKVG